MDIQAEKLSLIQWLIGVTEPTIIQKVVALKNHESIDLEEEEWDLLPQDHKDAIEEGLRQLDAGQGIPFKDVHLRLRKKYGLDD
jgi:hypothetical protein